MDAGYSRDEYLLAGRSVRRHLAGRDGRLCLTRSRQTSSLCDVGTEEGRWLSGYQEKLEQGFSVAESLVYRTIYEDKDILNTIHYLPGTLTKGDTTLSRYLKFLHNYPRAHPSAPFIH